MKRNIIVTLIAFFILLAITILGCDSSVKKKSAMKLENDTKITLEELENNIQATRVRLGAMESASEISTTRQQIKCLDRLLDNTKELKLVLSKTRDMKKIYDILSKANVISGRLNEIVDSTDPKFSDGLGDIGFKKGEYELSSDGKRLLHEMVEKISGQLAKVQRQYPHDALMLDIKSRGYADLYPPISKLNDFLTKEWRKRSDKEPSRSEKNQLLSEFRAAAVCVYLKQELVRRFGEPNVVVTCDIEGLGEEAPVPNRDYNDYDPDRRICTISVRIFRKNLEC